MIPKLISQNSLFPDTSYSDQLLTIYLEIWKVFQNSNIQLDAWLARYLNIFLPSQQIIAILEHTFSLFLTCQSLHLFIYFWSHSYRPSQVIILFLKFVSLLTNFCFYSCSYTIPSLRSYQHNLMRTALGHVTFLKTFYWLIIAVGSHPTSSLVHTAQHCLSRSSSHAAHFLAHWIPVTLFFISPTHQGSSCFRVFPSFVLSA